MYKMKNDVIISYFFCFFFQKGKSLLNNYTNSSNDITKILIKKQV